MADAYTEWQCPPAGRDERYRLGWINEATEEGQIWLRYQRGTTDFGKAFDTFSGRTDLTELSAYRSRFNTNRLKRNVRTVVGALADTRPLWGYHSDNVAFTGQAEMMNKVSRAIYLQGYFDLSIEDALKWAAATCTGFVRPVYRRTQGGKGRGSIQLLAYGSPSVLPVQMPSNGEWQEAYAVTLLDEMPIYMAHSYWPLKQHLLLPTKSKYWYEGGIQKAAQGNWLRRTFLRGDRQGEMRRTDLFIPIRYTTVIDNSINTTDQMIPMGEIDSPWFYEVPPVGGMVFDGYNAQGEKIYRQATVEDARLYPNRRLIISSENCILYDGPSFNWHGQLDLIPFVVDRWPWEPLGYSLVRDGFDIQANINTLERGMMDKYRAQLDVPLGYDFNAVDMPQANGFDPLEPRARIGFDGSSVDKPFVPVVPWEFYQISADIPNGIKHFEETLDYTMAINEVLSLAKARAMAGKANFDAAQMESNGPIVKDISRGMEKPLGQLGEQLKYLILQYMPTKKIMEYVGEDRVTRETFDYDPASLVPSHMPDEPMRDFEDREVGSRYSRAQRAKWFAEQLHFTILPHTAHEMQQMEHKLGLLQMRQRNIPIDSRTIAEAWDVPNFGNEPEGNTVWERFWNEKEQEVQHALRVQAIAQSVGLDLHLGGMGGPAPSGSGSGKGGGRPPSGQKAPQQKVKGDGRPTITES